MKDPHKQPRSVPLASIGRFFDSISWLFVDRVVRLVVGVIVTAWTARFLGPDQFGALNFAMAIVAIAGSLATMGLNSVVVRNLVREDDAGSILGTSFGLRFAGATIALTAVVAVVAVLRPGDPLALCMVAILGSCLPLQCSAVIRCWYESSVRVRYAVWVESAAFLLSAAAKIGFILGNAPTVYFAWAILVESLLAAVGLFAVYAWHGESLRAWSFGVARAKAMLADAWPIALSGIVIIIFMRIDQVMLGQIVGQSSVGIYAASVKVVEAVYVIPAIVMTAIFPALVATAPKTAARDKNFQALFSSLLAASLPLFLTVYFLSDFIIDLLFGDRYAISSSVTRILSFSIFFVTLGIVNSRWLLIHNLQKYGFIWASSGVVINVILNLILIPRYHAQGAAVATVVTQLFSATLLNGLSKHTRPALAMQLGAFLFRDLSVSWTVLRERKS